jgi:hypothetical protein
VLDLTVEVLNQSLAAAFEGPPRTGEQERQLLDVPLDGADQVVLNGTDGRHVNIFGLGVSRRVYRNGPVVADYA